MEVFTLNFDLLVNSDFLRRFVYNRRRKHRSRIPSRSRRLAAQWWWPSSPRISHKRTRTPVLAHIHTKRNARTHAHRCSEGCVIYFPTVRAQHCSCYQGLLDCESWRCRSNRRLPTRITCSLSRVVVDNVTSPRRWRCQLNLWVLRYQQLNTPPTARTRTPDQSFLLSSP